jgi:hypothetical protein
MALASSGTLSIGGSTANRSINLELGRSATATSNLNETDLRTLAGVASGTISISDFYGASAALDVQTVTVGLYTSKSGAYYGYGLAGGSISDGTFNPKGGASITRFEWASGGASLYFVLSGSHTNAGWTQVRIVSNLSTDYTFTRASASYNSNTNATQWVWSSTGSPFPYQSGSTTTAVATFT